MLPTLHQHLAIAKEGGDVSEHSHTYFTVIAEASSSKVTEDTGRASFHLASTVPNTPCFRYQVRLKLHMPFPRHSRHTYIVLCHFPYS